MLVRNKLLICVVTFNYTFAKCKNRLLEEFAIYYVHIQFTDSGDFSTVQSRPKVV